MDTYRARRPGSSNMEIVAMLSHLKVISNAEESERSRIESCALTFEKWKEHTAQLRQSSRLPWLS